MADEFAFDEIIEKCQLPEIAKIEDLAVILDCTVPSAPLPHVQCPDPLIAPPPLPGLDGVCPLFDVSVQVEVIGENEIPAVDVTLCKTPNNYPADGETLSEPLDLNDCNYTACFTFYMPSVPACPEIDFEARALSIGSATEPSVSIEKIVDPDNPCSYDVVFTFGLACADVQIVAEAKYQQIAPGDGIYVSIERRKEGCSYVFAATFGFPCPQITATAQVVRGSSAVCLVQQFGANVYRTYSDHEPSFENCGSVICNLEDIEIPDLEEDGLGCAYGIHLAFDNPCADILLDAEITRGGGSVSITKSSNVVDGDPKTTILTEEQILREMEGGFRTTPSGLSCDGTEAGAARNNCEYGFKIKFDNPCADIQMTPQLTSELTSDFTQLPTFTIESVYEEPVPNSGSACEHSFVLKVDSPRYCPSINASPGVAPDGMTVSISTGFDPTSCSYNLRVNISGTPCTPVTLSATVRTYMDCNTTCGTADLETSSNSCGGGYQDWFAQIVQAIVNRFASICVPTNNLKFFLPGDEIKITFDCCEMKWVISEGGRERVEATITRAGTDGYSGPQDEDEIDATIDEDGAEVEITVDKTKSESKIYKEGSKIFVAIASGCTYYIVGGQAYTMISGEFTPDDGTSSDHGTIKGVQVVSYIGDVDEGSHAIAQVNADDEVEVVSSECGSSVSPEE